MSHSLLPTASMRAGAEFVTRHMRSADALRLTVYGAIAISRLVYLFGGSWDIQWHITVGRDNLFIPPHMVAGFGFVLECACALALVLIESLRVRKQTAPPHTLVIGTWAAPLPVWCMLVSYVSALAAIIADDMWHRAFGLDARLWSPPHLALMTATASADAWMLIGLATTAQRLGRPFSLRNAWSWAFVFAAAYLVDVVHFAASEAFLVSVQLEGRFLSNALFPLLVGIVLPLPLLLIVQMAGRFRAVVPVIGVVVLLQYAGLGLGELGFALLRPNTANVDGYVAQNATSMIALTRATLAENGVSLVGFQQIWMFWLSVPPLLLVALLDRWPWARQHRLIAAPVYSAGLLLVCLLWFPFVPTAARYPISLVEASATLLLAIIGGSVMGAFGLWWARQAGDSE